MNFDALKERYEQNGKFVDRFRESIDILPFTSNPSTSNFDNSCSLKGITGEFFRLCEKSNCRPIQDYENDLEKHVKEHLQKNQLTPEKISKFADIMQDLMNAQGTFIPIDTSFLKFIPLQTKANKSTLSKYGDGQKKIAEYIFSMKDPEVSLKARDAKNNLFSRSIQEALNSKDFTSDGSNPNYYILPFVKKQFSADIQWFTSKEDYVILKYIDLFLYFYACYSIVQTIIKLNAEKLDADLTTPEPLFFILSKESASQKRDVITQGWSAKMSKQYVEKLFGRLQCADMLNTLVKQDHEPTGLYADILEELKKVSFDDHQKKQCKEILDYYKDKKVELINNRETSKKISDADLPDTNVDSYEPFVKTFEKLCKKLLSKEYEGKMLGRVNSLLKIRLLQIRQGRGSSVLVLDNELLTFLIAMVSKEERIKLKDLYSKFREYGICFDLHTKQAIEDELLKLNILERKSDSGEAQYVHIIL